MYICGLDISERAIHGSVIEDGGGHTIRQFLIPRSLGALRAELGGLMEEVGRSSKSLRLCASEYAPDTQGLLEPLLQKGYRWVPSPGKDVVDQLLLRADRMQQAEWDRAHLVASLALEDITYLEPLSKPRFCMQWSWLRTREKLQQLQILRAATRKIRPTTCRAHLYLPPRLVRDYLTV